MLCLDRVATALKSNAEGGAPVGAAGDLQKDRALLVGAWTCGGCKAGKGALPHPVGLTRVVQGGLSKGNHSCGCTYGMENSGASTPV